MPWIVRDERHGAVRCRVREASEVGSQHADADAPLLRLLMLGSLALAVSGRPATASARKAQALMLLLARRRGGQAPREVVTGLLWSDSAEPQARASLRQTLSVLRHDLGPAGQAIVSDGDVLLLVPDLVRTDVAEFELLAAKDDAESLAAAAALYRGDFAEGLPALTPEFDRWVEAERAYLRAQVSALLLRLCDAQAASGDLEASIATAHRLIALDPLQEHVHRRLMEAYLRLKRYDAALKQFDTLTSILDRELGVSPEPPTMELVRQVRTERSGRAKRAEPASPTKAPGSKSDVPGRLSIAVLPFRGLSPLPDSAIFGEGLSDEIIIELAREAGLMVVSRASSSRFEADAESFQTIGEALGVRFLLAGSIRLAAGRVRLTAHLAESRTGREVWAERYDRELSDLFEVQTEIARTLAATVVGRINDTEARAAESRSTRSLDAVAFLLQGERRLDEHTERGMMAAVEHFRQAAELAPNLARAHGFLALGCIYLRWYHRFAEPVDDIVPLGERAVALDWRDAKGHCALGVTHLVRRDYERAEYHLETGLQMNPNDDRLLIEHGRFLMYVGRSEEGLMRVREAMRLNPFHPNWYWNVKGRCLHTLGRFEEALAAFRHIPAPPFYVHVYMAACHRTLGHALAAGEAEAAMRQSRPNLDLDQFRKIFPYKDEAAGRHFFDSMFR